jgi:hypothetical protein
MDSEITQTMGTEAFVNNERPFQVMKAVLSERSTVSTSESNEASLLSGFLGSAYGLLTSISFRGCGMGD